LKVQTEKRTKEEDDDKEGSNQNKRTIEEGEGRLVPVAAGMDESER
jgi:hypothetical protein